MTSITIAHSLLFIPVTIHQDGQSLQLSRVLLDTGSTATVFRADDMEKLGIRLQPEDRIRYVLGVGGNEIVVEKQVTSIQVGDLIARTFTIQMGARIDFSKLEIGS